MAKDERRAIGGIARAAALTPERRKEIAKKGSAARWSREREMPQATYTGDLKIGDMVLPCSVLSDGTRILTQSDFMAGMGMYYSGWVAKNREDEASAGVPHFLAFKSLKPFVDKHLGDMQSITLKYKTERGSTAHGIRAEIIPKICEIWMDAEEQIRLGSRQKQIASKAKLVMRALAHVGIIALVDEATGFQRDRATNALAKILEEFIAKELQPWVKTFPDTYYEQLFRLRGLSFPGDTVKRPQYFGHLTNDIIYKRLAPVVLEELKRSTPKDGNGRRTQKLFQRLTPELGHPKLREHMASVLTIMKLSDNYDEFLNKLNKIHPQFDQTLPLDFGDEDGITGL